MKRIGLLSDTHGFWDEKYLEHFKECDEIWHAGDIGDNTICEKLSQGRVLRSVYGNIDGTEVRVGRKKTERFECEGIQVLLTHIGGYPGKYAPNIKMQLYQNPPQLFVCGHSHILKAMYDQELKIMHLNPGAAGIFGFHKVRTLMRFEIHQGHIQNLEVIELKDRMPTNPSNNQDKLSND